MRKNSQSSLPTKYPSTRATNITSTTNIKFGDDDDWGPPPRCIAVGDCVATGDAVLSGLILNWFEAD